MLILTIIIMIILATAVILSLNSSGIIDRATKAKNDSDMATVKEYVSMLEAEWELMTKDERKDYSSKEDYIDKKLEEKGYKDIYYANEIITGTVATIKEKNIPIGATVKGYALSDEASAKSITTDGNENDCMYYNDNSTNYPDDYMQAVTIIRDENISWKYIGADNDGNVLIAGDVTASSPSIKLSGEGGLIYGPPLLNTICSTFYSGNMGIARSIAVEDVVNVLEYTGARGSYLLAEMPDNGIPIASDVPLLFEEVRELYLSEYEDHEDIQGYRSSDSTGVTFSIDYSDYFSILSSTSSINSDRISYIFSGSYWLASRCGFANGWRADYRLRCVSNNSMNFINMHDSMGNEHQSQYGDVLAIRPVVKLNNDVQFTYLNGVITLG